MECSVCKNLVEDTAKYCSYCGASMIKTEMLTSSLKSVDTESGVVFSTGRKKLKPGDRILERFVIKEQIGEGGMSYVYKAQDTQLDETVALKIMKPSIALDESMALRFKREIKLARRIKHPNVCHIYDYGFYDEIPFISMEYLEGASLKAFMFQKGPRTFHEITTIMLGVIEAVSGAHSMDIIHRDLKPSNIIIDKRLQPIILDFGISRLGGESSITLKGELLGTPHYMPPEQFKNEITDERSDIYSLGVILYEVFTGELPFTGDKPIEIAMQHISEIPVSPLEKNPDLPRCIEAIIMKCMQKNPLDRYQDAESLKEDLKNCEERVTPKRTRQKILIVDDDEKIRHLIGLTLRKEDTDLIYAANGEEALEICLKERPDLITTDLMMPKMDGLQAIEFLLDNPLLKNIPIVVVSAKSEKDYISYCKSMGIREYFVKPPDFQRFVETIRDILNESRINNSKSMS